MISSQLDKRASQFDHRKSFVKFTKPLNYYKTFIEKQIKEKPTPNNLFTNSTSNNTLTPSQKIVYDFVRTKVETTVQVKIGVIAPAGYGKTFVLNHITRFLTRKKLNCDVISFTGV